MKKIVLLISLFISISMTNIWAQQYAFIDMEYILNRIPSFENANNQIEELSKQWQATIDKEVEVVNEMYKKYQSEISLLSGEDKTQRENEIIAKENEIQELRNRYFGSKGELFQQQENLIKPIQDSIYEAVKEMAVANGYAMVIDRASATSIIFASPSIDISDEVLSILGY